MAAMQISLGDQYVLVADDAALHVYSAAKLKKLLTLRPTENRLVAVAGTADGGAHLVDVRGAIISLRPDLSFAVLGSLSAGSGGKVGGSAAVARARRGAAADGATAISAAAFFHAPRTSCDGAVAKGAARLVALHSGGQVTSAALDGSAPVHVMTLSASVPDALLAVGDYSGLVVVAQKGHRWLHCAAFDNVNGAHERCVLSIAVCSLACHPTEPYVAVGGMRGELVLCYSVSSMRTFSDHWHHTPLAAMAFTADGSSLLTGAGESVLLLWSMADHSFQRIGCSLGPLRAVMPSAGARTGSEVLVAAAESTLAVVDLAQRRVARACEGVQWSAAHPCRGIVSASWLGTACVVLTGLPDSVRLYDPLAQRTLHTLHLSQGMETVANPPSVGVRHVAVFDEGRVVVTHEVFDVLGLPALLRWWRFDDAQRRHVETQAVSSPHDTEVLAMVPRPHASAVVTLSRYEAKLWGPGSNGKKQDAAGNNEDNKPEEADDKAATWINLSSCESVSSRANAIALSGDGGAAFIGDSVVRAYGLSRASQLGGKWALLGTFAQHVSSVPLAQIVSCDAARTVFAHNRTQLFLWSMVSGELLKTLALGSPACPITVCPMRNGESLVVVSNSTGRLLEIDAQSGRENGSATTAIARDVAFAVEVPVAAGSVVALVSKANGLKVVEAKFSAKGDAASKEVDLVVPAGSADAAAAAGAVASENGAGVAASLSRFFPTARRGPMLGNEADALADEALTRTLASASDRSRRWLDGVFGGEAYAAPPLSQVLDAYLDELQRQS